MNTGLRNVSISMSLALSLLAGTACSHNKDKKMEPADTVSSTETSASNSVDKAADRTEHAGHVAAAKTRDAAAHTAAKTRDAASDTAATVERETDSARSSASAAADTAVRDTDRTTSGSTDTAEAQNARPDNSRVNRLHDGNTGLSADQQGNSKDDVETTRKIRRAITKNKDLSTYAHNVKIITLNGRVTLKGPVRSDAERQIIEDTAVRVAGANNVISGLEIKSKEAGR